jgi:hypothetical protein
VRFQPYAFTEHGAIMAATVLNSPRAVEMSVFVVRAFVRLRQAFLARNAIEKRLDVIEKTLLVHDSGLRDLYDKLRPLLLPPPDPPRKAIGFGVKEKDGSETVIVASSRVPPAMRPLKMAFICSKPSTCQRSRVSGVRRGTVGNVRLLEFIGCTRGLTASFFTLGCWVGIVDREISSFPSSSVLMPVTTLVKMGWLVLRYANA